MDIYLSGISGIKKQLLSNELKAEDIFALESFYSMQDWEKSFVGKFGKFMLDSGAFTFMQKAKKIVWDEYIEQYAEFINKYDVKLFFELDIDGLIGLDNVEKLRSKLERLTNKQPIPVWHINRGKDYFIDMCKNYPYVALGGIAGAGDVATRKKAMKYFPWFINTAHKYNAKIHGLGFTQTNKLDVYNFDSVDSTTWTNAGRFGEIHRFNGKFIERITSIEKGQKIRNLKNPSTAAIHNFKEWLKFQDYARKNL